MRTTFGQTGFLPMKTPRLFALLGLLTSPLLLLSCKDEQQAAQQPPPAPTPQVDENEVERRVQQRLTEERLADEQRRAREREEQLNEREKTLKERERDLKNQAEENATPVVAQEPTRGEVANSYQIFYDALAPYGSWLEVENYGYVWQPRVAVENWRWRPYTDGHWAYTDYGWTWLSNEPFGWAAYHYGRWAKLRRLGWVWVPDDQWAPAWVSWRSSDRYVGWAPLPPEARFDGGSGIHDWADSRFDIGTSEYVFVPSSEFGDDRLSDAAVPPEQNVTIINETTNVTNIVSNNSMIVNYGPVFEAVQRRSRRPIARLRVEKRPVAKSGQNSTVVNGGAVLFAAPAIHRNNAQAKPAQVRARESDTKVASSPAPIGAGKRGQQTVGQTQTTQQQQQANATPWQQARPQPTVAGLPSPQVPAGRRNAAQQRMFQQDENALDQAQPTAGQTQQRRQNQIERRRSEQQLQNQPGLQQSGVHPSTTPPPAQHGTQNATNEKPSSQNAQNSAGAQSRRERAATEAQQSRQPAQAPVVLPDRLVNPAPAAVEPGASPVPGTILRTR
jgi:hypothetical protein